VESRDYLSEMPEELLQIELRKRLLGRYSLNSVSGFVSFPQTTRRFHSFFPEEHNLALNYLRLLLKHGDLGELEDAEYIWRAFPDLLTCRGTIFHPNRCYKDAQGNDLAVPINISFEKNPGRYKYINRTFYQILLMNSEFEEAEKAGELMTLEEKQKQFDEIFPDGEIKKYNFDLKVAQELLQAVFEAVAKDKSLKIERDEDNIKDIIMSDTTREALNRLYAYAKPKPEHEVGLVFDPEFYHAALKLYDDKCHRQFEQQWYRYTFWNICVEEWLAGCLGTRFLRSHAQGLDKLLTRRGCFLADGSSVFAFHRSSDSLPGHHLFVECYGHGTQVRRGVPLPASQANSLSATFEAYVKQQREQGQTLCGNLQRAGKLSHV